MKKLQNLGTQLSALEQKKILGGYGCDTGPCTLFDGNGNVYHGSCGLYDLGGGYWICECKTSYGVYVPAGDTSSCYSA